MQELILVGLIDLLAAGLASLPLAVVCSLRRRRPELTSVRERADSQPWARSA